MLSYEWEYDSNSVMQEEFISGHEITVAVKNGKAMGVLEILTNNNRFYNFKSKYSQGESQYITPMNINSDLVEKVKSYAEKAYNILGCRGIIRADFRVNSDK